MTPLERAHHVRDALPAEGLFAEKTWRVAPAPFELGAAHTELLEKLGIVLHHFNQACNLLYRQSAAGKAHPWVAPLLDAASHRNSSPFRAATKSKDKSLPSFVPT